MNDDSI
jgi:hypothetical protein